MHSGADKIRHDFVGFRDAAPGVLVSRLEYFSLSLARVRGACALDAGQAKLGRDLVLGKAVFEAQGPAQQISFTGDKKRFRQAYKSAEESGEGSVSKPWIAGGDTTHKCCR